MFGKRFPFACIGWIITVQHPAKITHHTLIANPLISFFFYCLDILVKSFYPTHHQLFQDFQEKTQSVNEENALSKTYDTPSLCMPQATLQYFLDIKVTYNFQNKLQQIHLNVRQARSFNVFKAFLNYEFSKTFRICGPPKIAFF